MGDQVKKGDVLATLDTTDLQRAVTHAEQAYIRCSNWPTAKRWKPIPRCGRGGSCLQQRARFLQRGPAGLQQSVHQRERAVLVIESAKTISIGRRPNTIDWPMIIRPSNYLNSDWGPYQKRGQRSIQTRNRPMSWRWLIAISPRLSLNDSQFAIGRSRKCKTRRPIWTRLFRRALKNRFKRRPRWRKRA